MGSEMCIRDSLGCVLRGYAPEFIQLTQTLLISSAERYSNGPHVRQLWLVVKELLNGQSYDIGAISGPVNAYSGIQQGEILLSNSERDGAGWLVHSTSS